MDATILRRAAEQAVSRQPELLWLQDARSRAVETFTRGGFPTVAEEDWRYTDLSRAANLIERSALQVAPCATGQQLDTLRGLLVPGAGSITAVFMDGIFLPELSRMPSTTGVTITRLLQVSPSMRGALAKQIGDTKQSRGRLATLNTALLQDGLVIDITAGMILKQPIYVVIAGADGVSYNRILVRLGAGSQATIIEHHASLGEGISNSLTEITCDEDSRLTFAKLQADSVSATHLASQEITITRSAAANVLHMDFGARLARNDLQVELSGERAEASVHGLFFADGSRHLDNHTRIDHRAPHTHSRELYRGIAADHGRGVFNGKIIVHSGALKSDARLTNQNLLLSRTAEIDTKPELEIYADDVKCSHGATTGQLDASSIFYLRSRGITADQAQRMMIASFAQEILKRTPAGPIAAHVVGILQDRLPELREVTASP